MILLTVVAALTAATPITLEEVRAASRQATTAQLAELERLRAQEQVSVARSSLLPQVGLNLSGTVFVGAPERRIVVDPQTGEERLVDVPAYARPQLGLSLGINQSLFDPGLWAQLGVANAQEAAATAQAAEEQLAAELEGIRRFYALRGAQQAAVVIATRGKASEELAVRAEALFQAGRRRKEDAISARINAVNDRAELVRQQATIALASANLALWIGKPGGELLEAVEPGPVTPAGFPVPSYGVVLEQARAQRPQLKALQSLADAANEAVSAARGAYLPRAGLEVGYQRSAIDDLQPFFNVAQQHTGYARLGIRWDLFNGFVTNAQVGQARVAERRALLTLEQARRDVEAILNARIEELRSALEVTKISEENLALAADNLALAQARFDEGAGTTLEIRDAQTKQSAAELQLLQARIQTELARAALEREMGALSPGVAQ